MPEETLRARIPWSTATGTRDDLLADALEEHVYRTIAELFGKEEGYCRGRGGGMHIADFATGHLGANAIVGGSVPIATGRRHGARATSGSDKVVCCFAGDGAYANGVVLESLNWAAQAQWTNDLAGDAPFGLPIIYLIQNNHYGMTHRTDDEVMGVEHLARRAAGFAENNMHAEVVNGMDVLAVRDAVARAAAICREGEGPVLLEVEHLPLLRPLPLRPAQRVPHPRRGGGLAGDGPDRAAEAPDRRSRRRRRSRARRDLEQRARERNARAAVRAAQARRTPTPPTSSAIIYTDTAADVVPEAATHRDHVRGSAGRDRARQRADHLSRRHHEALVEEMLRDERVILYGEDVADYGGAFKVTKGLLEAFGRERVFNTPISEAAICGTAVGAAMVGPAAGRRADVHGLRADGRPTRSSTRPPSGTT